MLIQHFYLQLQHGARCLPKMKLFSLPSLMQKRIQIFQSKTFLKRAFASHGQKGLVIYQDEVRCSSLIHRARLFAGFQTVLFLVAAETIYTIREKDEIEQEVNREIKLNMYTGEYGFLFMPAVIIIGTAMLVGVYFYVSRIPKKIYYIPKEKIMVLTNNLFGGESMVSAEVGHIVATPTNFKVKNVRGYFSIRDGAEIPNRKMFNMVMGVSGFRM